MDEGYSSRYPSDCRIVDPGAARRGRGEESPMKMKKLAVAVFTMLGAGAISQACDSGGTAGPGGGTGGGGTPSGSGGSTTGRGSGGAPGGGGMPGGGMGGVNIGIGDIGSTACSDGMDNDADGKIDLA